MPILLAALVAAPAIAADRALLVGGVGKYQKMEWDLKGIDLDIEMMRKVAANLGFAAGDTKVLLNEDATQAALQAHLTDWLRRGVTADDKVLIYFSTHGTQVPDQNGDEDDGVDEALTLYDLRNSLGPDGQPTLTGILLDDDFERALAAIPNRNALVLIDACHSGTVVRAVQLSSLQSGSAESQAKFFAYPGMPRSLSRGLGQMVAKGGQSYVSIAAAAAADDEQSLATDRGSLFTQGLAQAIGQTVSIGGSLTPQQLRDATAAFVVEQLGQKDRSRIFHPQLGGDPTLANKPLRLVGVTAGHGPTWDKVQALVGRLNPLSFQTNQQRFREGEKLELTIDVPRDGYLNVINIDARDTPIVVFPNGFHRDNRVRAGRLNIPGDLPFELPASTPYGPTLLVSFFTDEPVNLFENGDGWRDVAGNMLDAFPQLSQIGMRGFVPTAKTARAMAGALDVTVCPASGCP
ncbi:caspase family protein [uncultured Thiocystis sp.]|uniref:caspase family protein n=1 Tax=uncultured Thiocystis sp. TaxID=1202134 RepID=UPI0025CDD3BB|nr:caspase family protein [uncultured Thiocystis sp.]